MLKSPAKRFGILPTGEFIAGVILFVMFIVGPLINTAVKFLTGAEIPGTEAFLTGIRGAILIVFLGFYFSQGRNGITIYGVSKRERYLRKHLIPFLNKKYGIKIDTKDRSNVLHLPLASTIKATKDGKPIEDIHFMGWDEIEKVSDTGKKEEELGKMVCIVTLDEEDHSLLEIEPVGYKEGDSRIVFRHPEETPALEETETGIKNMLFDIISSLPVSETVIRCAAATSSEIPGIDAEMRVSVDPGGAVSYSSADLKEIMDAILFNVRMTGNTLVVALINTPNGKTYVSGRVVANGGYSDVEGEVLKTMSHSDDNDSMVFLDDLKSIS